MILFASKLSDHKGELQQMPLRPILGLLIQDLRDCIDKYFQGYHGGMYKMDDTSFVYIANWGKSRSFILDEFNEKGEIISFVTGVRKESDKILLEFEDRFVKS